MSQSINRVYIPAIDHIRAFAALLVVSYHGLQLLGARLAYGVSFDPEKHWLHHANGFMTFIEEGHSGVGLFIVLSGFVLSLGVIDNNIDYKKFLSARILRIYPMLVLCLIMAISIRPANAWEFLTYLSPVHSAGIGGGVFTTMFWAVAVEFQCYLIFPFLNKTANQKGNIYIVSIIFMLMILSLLAVYSETGNPRDISYLTLMGRLGQFCIGMIAARLYVKYDLKRLSAWFILPAVFLVAGALNVFNWVGGYPAISDWKILWQPIEGVMWGIFILSYLPFAGIIPKIISSIIGKFGEITYSFYLLHFAVITSVINKNWYIRWTHDGHVNALLTVLVVVVPITTLISIVTYKNIEVPFLKLRPKYIIYPA